MKIFFLLILFLPLLGYSQNSKELTPEERAYLFHAVKKSPILDTNLGRYFDYIGPKIKYPNKSINYDSIESLIIFKPELLIIRNEEIAKSEKGLLSEVANKMALWELNRILYAKRDSDSALLPFLDKYAAFEKIFVRYLPPNALVKSEGRMVPNKKLDNLLNPTLSFDDKNAFLASYYFLTQNDKLVTFQGVDKAVNEYVEKRAFEIFQLLGGEADIFENILLAAGDGSSSGDQQGREKEEKGIWNTSLPKAVGLFPYQVELVTSPENNDQKIEPLLFPELNLLTVGNNRITNLHFDVWSYSSKYQTTVVIEKNGLSYHLFGSDDTRFLSPDSSFSGSTTFQKIINELEFDKIAHLQEMIHGKKGFDYWIKYNQKKKDQTELKIIKYEKKYSDFGYQKVVTNKKMSKAVKKQKKNAAPGTAKDYQPTTMSNKDERKVVQESIVGLYTLFDNYNKRIEELKEQKRQAMALMAKYQRRLDSYKQLLGFNWAKYTVKDGLYTFQDSTIFDIYTQEFQFRETEGSEDFEIRLLSVPETALSEVTDEVMLHINLMDALPNYDARLRLELNDVFASDKWDLSRPLFEKKDSVAVRQFFEGLINKKNQFSIAAKGQGIGYWNGARTVKNSKSVEELSYKGSRMDSTYLRLRKSELFVILDREIKIEVNSYTDPVASNMNIGNPAILALMKKYKLSKNDILSVYRTATILRKFNQEMTSLAAIYLEKESAKIVIDRIKGELLKTKIKVGSTSIKLNDIK
jgi:hypothetical protein